MADRDLARRIEAATGELVEEAVQAMYRDPFWMDRFGEQGLIAARSDGAYHVGYLVRALQAGGAGTLQAYARWLQGVLVSRGMCTRHLDESFARLQHALLRRALDEGGRAAELLARARDALTYEGRGRALQLAASGLVERAAQSLLQGDGATRAQAEEELRAFASYLADARALGSAATLVEHARWRRGFHARCGIGLGTLVARLRALRGAVEAEPALPAEERDFALAALGGALAAVEAREAVS